VGSVLNNPNTSQMTIKELEENAKLSEIVVGEKIIKLSEGLLVEGSSKFSPKNSV